MSAGEPIVEFNLASIGNLFKRSDKPVPERDAAGLPYTDKDHIELLKREYESKAVHGGREAVEACFK